MHRPPHSGKKIEARDGIAVYRRDVPGSDVVALRGEAVVGAPLLRVATVLTDTARSTEWIDSLAEARVIRVISDREIVEWDHIRTPFLLRDRDFVYRAKAGLRPEHKQLVIDYHSVTDPLAPKTTYVRGKIVYGIFVLTSIDHGRSTQVLAELFCDPKGSVPKWLVNLFQKRWPYNTIQALRRQAHKPDIVDDPRIREALAREHF
jgi:hypothetical protein